MQHFFVKNNQVESKKIKIDGEDVNHIKNVLRCKIGEKLEISNLDKPEKYIVEIIELNNENIDCNIIESMEDNSEAEVEITIVQGLPKMDKMELIIQKCTELGVKEIVPFELERCIVKLDLKDISKKIARWTSIAEAAVKQCKRRNITMINEVHNIKNIDEIIDKNDLTILTYEDEKDKGLKDVLNELKYRNLQQELAIYGGEGTKVNVNSNLKIAIIIGPEGGFTEKEVDILKKKGAKSVSLGKRILRTETVAIAVSSIILYELDNLGEV